MRFIKVFIIAFLLLYVMPVHYADAAVEITKPTIESMQVDTKQVTARDVVTIYVLECREMRYTNL